jgi:competence ComEA-like helix-hairpin-helix protein
LCAQSYLPDGRGKEILDNYCQECHTLDPIVQQSLSAPEWRKTIGRMVKKGANLKPADVNALVEYLTAYFGPETSPAKVNINEAAAEELQKTLGMSRSEAEALAAYRKSHPRFKNWHDLAAAAVIDSKKLESKKDSIVF